MARPEFIAWVPDDEPQRPWDVGGELASDWIEERASAEGVNPVLVTNAMNVQPPDALAGYQQTTHRSGRNSGFGIGPVISFVPHGRELDYAMNLAHRSSIVVIETVSFPLKGWAAASGAINLLTSEVTPPPPEPLAAALERLKFYGNNGFTGPFEKQQARSILIDLRAAEGRIDSDAITSAMLAQGVSPQGAARLGELITKL